MKSISIVILILLLSFSTTAESQWVSYTLPYNGLAFELGFYNANSGISIGHTLMTFQERIFFTTNAGLNWLQASSPLEIRALVNLQYINSSIVYSCGAENNFGFSQKPTGFANLPYQVRQSFYIKGISEFFSEYKTAFLKSTNGGVNWFKVGTFDTTTGYMNDIHFFDESMGYALIDTSPSTNPKFYKTFNGGNSWQSLGKIDDSIYLDNMHFFNENTGFVCGATFNYNLLFQKGRIYKTTNGGLNWQKTEKTNMQSLTDIAFYNSSTGLAIGSSFPGNFKCFRTTNSGTSWDSVAFFSEVVFYNVKVVNGSGIAFMVGNYFDINSGIGKIATAKTTDYGTTWTLKSINQTDLTTGLALIDANKFYMSGGVNDAAKILKSTNGGNVFIQQIGNEIPSSFSLEQNFPNPFNQSSIIQFKVPPCNSGEGESFDIPIYRDRNPYISIIIFNILGKEIATLVNEYKQPGTYQVSFNAEGITSGIYFYKLTSGDFSQVRKMIFLK